jgi:hypothetical protein
LFGRLARGVTAAHARAVAQVVRGQVIEIVETGVDRDKTIALTLQPAYFGGTDDIRFQALVALLMTVVGLILLVVCFNFAICCWRGQRFGRRKSASA